MAERMVRIIKEHTIKLERYAAPEEAVISLLQFQDTHNFKCRLKVLGFKTPYQITMEWFIKELRLFIKNPNELLIIR